ncbi:MAG: SMC-Scp complex subunit ScpB [Minisyncoccia bacterium]
MDEKNNNQLAQLEAFLFAYGEAISILNIAKYLNLSLEEAEKLILDYELELQNEKRGLVILKNNDLVQLGTKPEYSYLIEDLIKKDLDEDLTPASLETLSIILYFGPISRSKIEYLRGVDSSFILRSLVLRGLVERFPDPKFPQAYLYDASFKLLRHLGITKKENLPDYEKFKKLNEQFEKEKESVIVENSQAENGLVDLNEANDLKENQS